MKLYYLGKSWCTVKFELGHNEIGDAGKPEYQISADLSELFIQVGLEAPKPVPVMGADHQIAQNSHAVSAAGSERARDLVDLQLLDERETLDFSQIYVTFVRLFKYRWQQAWPPTIPMGEHWDTLYAEAVEGLDLLATATEAVGWANEFVKRIEMSG